MKSLKKKVGDGELLVIPTDKSGKLVVSSHEDYVASMQPHIANDETITLEERNTIENTLNGHTIQLGKILKMGKDHKHWDRIKNALVNKAGHRSQSHKK